MPNFFVSGIPRSGTSLLSSLLNSHPDIGCAQDTGLITSFKFALAEYASSLYSEHELIPGIKAGQLPAYNLAHYLQVDNDLQFKGFIDAASARPLANLMSEHSNMGRVFSRFIQHYLLGMWLGDFQIPDPRKDRAIGISYMKCVDWHRLLGNQLSYVELVETFIPAFVSL